MISQKIKKYKRHFSELSWIAAGKILSFVGMLFLVSLLTKNLSMTDYGNLALGLTLCNFINQIILGAVSQGVGRFFLIARENSDLDNFKKSSLQIICKAILLISLLGLLISMAVILINRSYLIPVIFLLIIFSLISGLNEIISFIQSLSRKRMRVAIFGGLDAWSKAFIVMLLIYAGLINVSSVILAYILAGLLIFFSQISRFTKIFDENIGSKKNKIEWQADMWKFILPTSTWGVFVWVQQASDKWALKLFSGASDVAQFSVLYQIGYMPFIIGIGLIITLAHPSIYEKSTPIGTSLDAHAGNHRVVFFVLKLVALLTFVAASMMWIFGANIIDLFATEDYTGIVQFLPVMTLAAGVFSAADLIYIKMMGELRVKEILFIKCVVSILGVLLNVAGARYFGVLGAVFANLIFTVLYFLAMMVAAYLVRSPFKKV